MIAGLPKRLQENVTVCFGMQFFFGVVSKKEGMNMKKVLVLVVTLVLIFSLGITTIAAPGNSNKGNGKVPKEEKALAKEEKALAKEAEKNLSKEGKVLDKEEKDLEKADKQVKKEIQKKFKDELNEKKKDVVKQKSLTYEDFLE